MPRRSDDPSSEERRAEILQVAAEIFSEKGYRAATLNDIADRLGFSTAALYYWFNNKQAILTAVVLDTGERLLEGLAELQRDEAPRERLRQLVRLHVGLIIENPAAAGVFLTEKAALSPQDRKRLEDGEREYVHGLAAVIQEGIEAGDFANQPALPAALLIVGMVSWTSRWYHPSGDLTPSGLADMICAFALGGLTGDDRRRR